MHQYGYGRDDEPIHSQRQASMPMPGMGQRQFSGNSYPIMEERDEKSANRGHSSVLRSPVDAIRSSPSPLSMPEKPGGDYMDPYEDAPAPAPAPHPSRPKPDRMPSRGLSSLFQFGTNPDLSLKAHPQPNDGMTRGGAHRGTKDYPYRKGSAGDDVAAEAEERRGLVGGRMSEDVQDNSVERDSIDEGPVRPRVAEAPPKMRRLPDLPEGGRR